MAVNTLKANKNINSNPFKSGDLLVSVKNVGVRFRQNRSIFKKGYFNAINDISLNIYAGETIGIIGKNGAGKSTLLKLIAGIIKPDSGDIVNYGATSSLLALQAGFEAELSGKDNIYLSGMLLGFNKSSIQKNYDKILEFSELGDHINSPARTYSNGMITRLGFSIAYLLDPDILLIDETLGVGDIRFRNKSTKAMKKKIQSTNQTVVLVSHHANIISELCDRVVWVEDGISIKEGDTQNILYEYENK